MTTTFDSYAWIEYFAGTKKGEKVQTILDDNDPKYTPAICITEIKNKYLKEKINPDNRIAYIRQRTTIIDLTEEIASDAADLMNQEKLHTTDAIIYASAKSVNSKLMTGDQHFRKKPDVIFLE